MKILKKEDLLVLLLSFFIFVSFVSGFVLNENSAGAGGDNGDFVQIWNALQLFKEGILENLNSFEYDDSRNPLIYIIHVLFNPFIDTKYQFRMSVLFISLLCLPFFYYALREKYKNINNYLAMLITSLILLSPYFRTSAFWGLGENYGILFSLITYLIFKKKIINRNFNNISPIYLFLLSLSSSLCVYFDLKLIIVPLICFVSILLNKHTDNKNKILLTLFYVFLSSPLFYMMYLWMGILPPAQQLARQPGSFFGIYNIGYAITIIAFYVFPFLLFEKKKLFILIDNFFVKKNIFYFLIFAIYLGFIIYFYNTFNSQDLGNGIVHKFANLVFADIKTQFIFTVIAFFVSWIIINIFFDKILVDKLIIFYFVILSALTNPIQQEYFDPIIIIFIFTFLNRKIKINYKNIFILTIYLSIFLTSTNLYYKYTL